ALLRVLHRFISFPDVLARHSIEVGLQLAHVVSNLAVALGQSLHFCGALLNQNVNLFEFPLRLYILAFKVVDELAECPFFAVRFGHLSFCPALSYSSLRISSRRTQPRLSAYTAACVRSSTPSLRRMDV